MATNPIILSVQEPTYWPLTAKRSEMERRPPEEKYRITVPSGSELAGKPVMVFVPETGVAVRAVAVPESADNKPGKAPIDLYNRLRVVQPKDGSVVPMPGMNYWNEALRKYLVEGKPIEGWEQMMKLSTGDSFERAKEAWKSGKYGKAFGYAMANSFLPQIHAFPFSPVRSLRYWWDRTTSHLNGELYRLDPGLKNVVVWPVDENSPRELGQVQHYASQRKGDRLTIQIGRNNIVTVQVPKEPTKPSMNNRSVFTPITEFIPPLPEKMRDNPKKPEKPEPPKEPGKNPQQAPLQRVAIPASVVIPPLATPAEQQPQRGTNTPPPLQKVVIPAPPSVVIPPSATPAEQQPQRGTNTPLPEVAIPAPPSVVVPPSATRAEQERREEVTTTVAPDLQNESNKTETEVDGNNLPPAPSPAPLQKVREAIPTTTPSAAAAQPAAPAKVALWDNSGYLATLEKQADGSYAITRENIVLQHQYEPFQYLAQKKDLKYRDENGKVVGLDREQAMNWGLFPAKYIAQSNDQQLCQTEGIGMQQGQTEEMEP